MKEEIIQAGQMRIRFLMESGDTNGALSAFEFTVPAGAKVPIPHYHKEFDETIYGVEGEMTFTMEGKQIEISPGHSFFIPRGAVHGFNNLGKADAKALAIITPGLLGPEYFQEIAVIANAGGPPDIEKLKGVMLKHGLVPVVPQIA